jgi:hypothetical protein
MDEVVVEVEDQLSDLHYESESRKVVEWQGLEPTLIFVSQSKIIS